MSQPREGVAFLERISALPPGPGVSLAPAIQPTLEDETTLRRLFATDRANARLEDPYVGLVDVFGDGTDAIKRTRARVVKDEEDLSAHYIMALDEKRRRKDGAPAIADTFADFKYNWNIFTEGSLANLIDWNNVVAAGGSVLAALLPLPDHAKESKRTLRKYYHQEAYPSSDVDLFLWGLTPEEAEKKAIAIWEAVRDSVPWETVCVRTKNAISIHSQYPYRPIQIVLRLYRSPAEVLAGFDVDAPCAAFDGTRVWANPRAIVSWMTQCNTIDMTRRSPSYEVRLAKYSARGFEIYVPDLRREDIDPTIFERSITHIKGLARLLVFEKISNTTEKDEYLDARRKVRGRPEISAYRRARRARELAGDLKAETGYAGLELSNYDTAFHVPYGPKYDARKIEKIVYKTDLAINSTFNPKNKGRRLHRHPAFFGKMAECIEDCCRHCPEPRSEEETKLQEEEDKQYIRGRITFLEEDPGRQSITGSFQPIDVGEWSELAYIVSLEKLFKAIATDDRAAVAAMIKEGYDLQRRDHVGRTALHLAILSEASDVACDLIDAGVRISSRLADGRTALHLASGMNMPTVVQKLLEKSKANAAEQEAREQEAEAKKKEKKKKTKSASESQTQAEILDEDEAMEEDGGEAVKEDSDEAMEEAKSDDDWSEVDQEDSESEDGNGAGQKDAEANLPAEDEPIPEDSDETPDILDIELTDWDNKLSPLGYAIISGAITIVGILLAAGADPSATLGKEDYYASRLHPLTLTLLTQNDAAASNIVERLVEAGATCGTADDNMMTIFHRAVYDGKVNVASTMLRVDPTARLAANVIARAKGTSTQMVYPLAIAISNNARSLLTLLLAYGANPVITRDTYERAIDVLPSVYRTNSDDPEAAFRAAILLPLEISIASQNDFYALLTDLGVGVDDPPQYAFERTWLGEEVKLSLLDYARRAIPELTKIIEKRSKPLQAVSSQAGATWAEEFKRLDDLHALEKAQEQASSPEDAGRERAKATAAREYFVKLLSFLEQRGAKTWKEIFAEKASNPSDAPSGGRRMLGVNSRPKPASEEDEEVKPPSFVKLSRNMWQTNPVPQHTIPRYQKLFEACWTGDNALVQELCLPAKQKKGSDKPLQIAVKMTSATDSGKEYTPLDVAIRARRWDTARLIMGTAAAQYQEPEKKESAFKPSGIVLHDDDDDENDEDLDEDDISEDDTAIVYEDIAARLSSVRCDISPSMLLVKPPSYGNSSENVALSNAIANNDLEAFIKICDLMVLLDEPVEPGKSDLQSVIQADSPAILDEFIRRTGLGISFAIAETSEADKEVDTESNLYLGLDIQGKKRKDLARSGDPAAPKGGQDIPLLWLAAQKGATKCVEYLAGSGPLTAYQFYISTHKNERARVLGRIPDFSDQLPKLLGFAQNSFGVTPVLVALLSTKLDDKDKAKGRFATLKALIASAPKMTPGHFNTRTKWFGITPLMAACGSGASVQCFDYLLANGALPDTRDNRGWNIFHILCHLDRLDLLRHALGKLSAATASELLTQSSYKQNDTPVMLAVKSGRLATVELLLSHKKSVIVPMLLVRDGAGFIPLHVAARKGYASIVSVLAAAGPPEALHLENGVGDTPREIARMQAVFAAVDRVTVAAEINSIETNGDIPVDRPASLNETDVKELRGLLSTLGQTSSKLSSNPELQAKLQAFVERSEYALGTLPPKEEGKQKSTNEESKDPTRTWEVISKAIPAGRRRLIHLIDAQIAVAKTLQIKAAAAKYSAYGQREVSAEQVHEIAYTQDHPWVSRSDGLL